MSIKFNSPSFSDYIRRLDSALILKERLVISIHPAQGHAAIANIS